MVYRAWIGRRDHTHFTKKKKFVLVDCQPLFGQFGGRKEQLERMRNARATERKKKFSESPTTHRLFYWAF